MSKEYHQKKVRLYLESIIKELEVLYLSKFEKLVELEIREALVVKISKLLIQSRETALNPLKKELELQAKNQKKQ